MSHTQNSTFGDQTAVHINGHHIPIVPMTYKPTPDTSTAKFQGIDARCGCCHRKLGEFISVNGAIACKKCGTVNILKK